MPLGMGEGLALYREMTSRRTPCRAHFANGRKALSVSLEPTNLRRLMSECRAWAIVAFGNI